MSTRRLVAGFLRAFILTGFSFLVFEIACWIHPPVMAWGLAVAGRAVICSSAEVYRGTSNRVRQEELASTFTKSAKLVQRDGELALWQTAGGNWWTPGASETKLPYLLAQQRAGIYDPKTFTGKIVLDCGAHIGLYTREAIEAGAERVIAIEPSPGNVASLRRNVALIPGAADKVTVYPVGVWNEETTLKLYHTPNNSAGDSFVAKIEGDEEIDLPVTTIDKIAADLKLPAVNLIKMDVKGATIRALNGAAATIAKYHPKIVISTEEREDSADEIIAWLAKRGYRSRCGECAVDSALHVSPTVVYFE